MGFTFQHGKIRWRTNIWMLWKGTGQGVGREWEWRLLFKKGGSRYVITKKMPLEKRLARKKTESGGRPQEKHPSRANGKSSKCLSWETASSVQQQRGEKWDCSRVRNRGVAGDELREEARDLSSRDLLTMARKVNFFFNERSATEEFWAGVCNST